MIRLNIISALTVLGFAVSATPQALAGDDGAGVINNPVKNTSVVGRTYCGVTRTLTNLPIPGFEITSSVGRRKTTFLEGGVFTTEFLSGNSNTYLSDGTVVSNVGAGNDGVGSYVQTGAKLDLTLSSGLLATWYVSSDGSALHGTRIMNFMAMNGETVGRTITWTFVESDVCEGEL